MFYPPNQLEDKILANELRTCIVTTVYKRSNWQVKHWQMVFYLLNLPIFPMPSISHVRYLDQYLIQVFYSGRSRCNRL